MILRLKMIAQLQRHICRFVHQVLRKRSNGRSNASSLPFRPKVWVSPRKPTLSQLWGAMSSLSLAKIHAALNLDFESLKLTSRCMWAESVPLQLCRKFVWSGPTCCSPNFPTWSGLVRSPCRHRATSYETFSYHSWLCHWNNRHSSSTWAIWSSGCDRLACTSQHPP